VLRKIVSGLGALLALFHIWLFAGQIWSGRLADPGLLFRWLLAAGLIAALVSLRRQGAPLLFGRRAISVWLLAALLHGPALAARLDDGFAPMVPEVVATIGQIASAVVGLTLVIAVLAAAAATVVAPSTYLLGLSLRLPRRTAVVLARSGRSSRPPPTRHSS
jgi:hypothetical protein